jgi:hypothetical protein
LFGAEFVVNLASAPARARHSISPSGACAARLNLRRVTIASRMPGHRPCENGHAPETYAQRVVWGDMEDACASRWAWASSTAA